MGDDNTLSGTANSTPSKAEQTTADATPKDEQSTSVNQEKTMSPPDRSGEKSHVALSSEAGHDVPPQPITPVGVELSPTGDEEDDPAEPDEALPALSEFFRTGVLKTMQNTIFAVEDISDMHRKKRISRGLRNHLEREAIKFGASQICKMTEKEIRESK